MSARTGSTDLKSANLQCRSASQILEADFLHIRHRLLDVAATLDRIRRGQGRDRLRDDPRMEQIQNAIAVLSDSDSDRAARLQTVFSRPYNPNWQH